MSSLDKLGLPWSNKQEYFAKVWNEGEEPETLVVESRPLDSGVNLYQYEAAIGKQLDTKDFGCITALRREMGSDKYIEISLYYAAATDPQRGRFRVSGMSLADAKQSLIDQQKRHELKCFTSRELYGLKPISTDHELYFLTSVHLSDELDGAWSINIDAAEATQVIEIRTLVDECSDGRRTK